MERYKNGDCDCLLFSFSYVLVKPRRVHRLLVFWYRLFVLLFSFPLQSHLFENAPTIAIGKKFSSPIYQEVEYSLQYRDFRPGKRFVRQEGSVACHWNGEFLVFHAYCEFTPCMFMHAEGIVFNFITRNRSTLSKSCRK